MKELVSEEVKELMSYRPHWIVRKGNVIFFLVVASLLTLTWFVQYPDIINGSVRLIAVNPPKLLTARSEGKLEKILVVNEQNVYEDQPLAFLQSTSRHEEVLELKQWIDSVELAVFRGQLNILLQKPLPLFSRLGEIQAAYQEFQNSLGETMQLLASGYYQQKYKYLQTDLQFINAIQENFQKQQDLMKQDFALQEIEYKAKEALAKDKVIAPLEFNQDKSKIIAKEYTLGQLQGELINNNIMEHNKRKEILDLRKAILDQHQKFLSALMTLKSRVDEWIQQYVVKAPVRGKLLFTSFLQENQLLNLQQDLFYVQPPQSRFYGELMASQHGLGKLKPGQKVLIKPASYPSEEFGYLTGTISYISSFPNANDSFLVKIDLPNGLVTNYKKTIFFRNNLLAQGEVITDDRRLFDRFWGQVRQLINR